jgi:hypothetical protein
MQRVKLDPIAYFLLAAVLAVQIYVAFLGRDDPSEVLRTNDALYQSAVFDSDDNKGVMHQVFRQNEANRELLKYVVEHCGR